MNIRRATTEDVEQIAQLQAEFWQQTYVDIFSKFYLEQRVLDERRFNWGKRLSYSTDERLVLVAVDGHSLVGFIVFTIRSTYKSDLLIESLYFRPDYLIKGVGKLLFLECAKWGIVNYPGRGIYIEVIDRNSTILGLSKQLGGLKLHENEWYTPENKLVKEFVFYWESPENLLDAKVA